MNGNRSAFPPPSTMSTSATHGSALAVSLLLVFSLLSAVGFGPAVVQPPGQGPDAACFEPALLGAAISVADLGQRNVHFFERVDSNALAAGRVLIGPAWKASFFSAEAADRLALIAGAKSIPIRAPPRLLF